MWWIMTESRGQPITVHVNLERAVDGPDSVDKGMGAATFISPAIIHYCL